MRISDWSSDVCSSDLRAGSGARAQLRQEQRAVVQPPLWKPRLQLLWPELLTGGAGPPAGAARLRFTAKLLCGDRAAVILDIGMAAASCCAKESGVLDGQGRKGRPRRGDACGNAGVQPRCSGRAALPLPGAERKTTRMNSST